MSTNVKAGSLDALVRLGPCPICGDPGCIGNECSPEDPSDDDGPLGPEGCLFPGRCCMPGPHYVSECHTPEHLIEDEAVARDFRAHYRRHKRTMRMRRKQPNAQVGHGGEEMTQ